LFILTLLYVSNSMHEKPAMIWPRGVLQFGWREVLIRVGWLTICLCSNNGCVAYNYNGSTIVVKPNSERTLVRLRADPDRLETDLCRATVKLQWAVMSLDRRPAALEMGSLDHPPTSELLSAMAWRLVALLPDGRTAEVIAWSPRSGWVEVVARVGYFGNEAFEQRFIAMLRDTLAGPPQRVRSHKLVLP